MRIIKKYQGTVPENRIMSTYTNSNTDTYSCDYVNKISDYSTSEVVVGKWIDGKPIYRKVVEFGALPNTTEKAVSYNADNINFVTSIKGTVKNGNLYTELINTINYLYVDTSRKTINIVTSSDLTARTATVTLEYTKTTD